jgi:hypothetical protein
MNSHSSIPALAVSFALLGLVAWMAASHFRAGSLFAPSTPQVTVRTVPQSAAPASPRPADVH